MDITVVDASFSQEEANIKSLQKLIAILIRGLGVVSLNIVWNFQEQNRMC